MRLCLMRYFYLVNIVNGIFTALDADDVGQGHDPVH